MTYTPPEQEFALSPEFEELQNFSEPEPTILTLEEYKTLRRITSTEYDNQIKLGLSYIDDIIVRYTNRDFVTVPRNETRTYLYEASGIQDIDDCTNITKVELNALTSLDLEEQYVPGPLNGPVFEYIDLGPHLPFWFLSGSPEMGFMSNRDVLYYESLNWGTSLPRALQRRFNFLKVTATFGWPTGTIPASVKMAACLLMDEVRAQEAESTGLAAESIANLHYTYLQGSPLAAPAVLSPRIRALLDAYRRPEL